MRYINGLINLIISLIISTAIIYAINIIAGFAGADYSFSNGEVFIIWILMAILVNNCNGRKQMIYTEKYLRSIVRKRMRKY